MSIKKAAVISLLKAYHPMNEQQKGMLKETVTFVQDANQPCSRQELKGHLTASAWIVNFSYTKALLVYHAQLHRWLQPGGHIEDKDTDIGATAMREAREETGLQSLRFASHKLFDLDVHVIPTHGNDLQHLHYDCRFILEANESEPLKISSESEDLRWMIIDDLSKENQDESIARLIQKTLSKSQ